MTQNSKSGYIRTEEQALIDTEALRMRSSGLGYRAIARAQGVDISTAHRRVSRALGEIPRAVAEEYRLIELDRLDALQVSVWDKALSGDYKASRMVLDIMTRRAKLLGLDKIYEEHHELSAEWLDQEIAKLEKQIREAEANPEPLD